MVYAFIVPSLAARAAGLAFAHFVVIPRVVAALIHITDAVATPTFGIASTLNFVMVLLALFAIVFQTPIVLIGLARIGIVNAASLMRYRRHALFGVLRRRRHRRARRQPADDGAARRADVRALRDVDLGDSAAARTRWSHE